MIEFRNIRKKFGKNEVLSDIDLSIREGGVFSILGPNGSGKTTLIKCLLGMVIPDHGEIFLHGEEIGGCYKYRQNIGYLPQIANFPANLNVEELIRMIKNLRGLKANKDVPLISRFGLQPYLKKTMNSLSGGTKQKVNLVLAFMSDSPLLILDEPTNGLDPIALLHLKELIIEEKSKGKTLLITSHILNFVEEISDHIVFILEGKVHFTGGIGELKTKTQERDFERAIASILSLSYV